MKSSKIWKYVWIVGIYLILSVILYLVILYKVEWEHRDLNTYLYFYDCNRSLCTSTTIQKGYYSRILCENQKCPYITNIIDDNLILENENSNWIYDYINGEIVNNDYVSYRYIGNDMFVVLDSLDNQGIIDLLGNVIVDLKYEYIDDYDNGFISYMKNNMYGVDTIEGINKVDANFQHIILINDSIFSGMQNNVYKIYSYDNLDSENNTDIYNYVYAYNDVILVATDNKIDILTTDLNSTLLMKINTFYEYKTEKERDSLELYSDGNFLHFRVFTSEYDYTQYTYSIADKRLV